MCPVHLVLSQFILINVNPYSGINLFYQEHGFTAYQDSLDLILKNNNTFSGDHCTINRPDFIDVKPAAEHIHLHVSLRLVNL